MLPVPAVSSSRLLRIVRPSTRTLFAFRNERIVMSLPVARGVVAM
jgi:hypothetical protein